jgi:hypothetical protein
LEDRSIDGRMGSEYLRKGGIWLAQDRYWWWVLVNSDEPSGSSGTELVS